MRKNGYLRGPIRSAEHKEFVRSCGCVVNSTTPGDCHGDIVAAHFRTAANSGTGTKPSDEWTVPLCDKHHQEQHKHGVITFCDHYKLDLIKIMRDLAADSPDSRIRARASLIK